MIEVTFLCDYQNFNSRARGGRDCVIQCDVSISIRFQLTRPRGARPRIPAALARIYSISTHAPAGGATLLKFSDKSFMCISTHAPAGGATRNSLLQVLFRYHFNSRARGGRDQCVRDPRQHFRNFNSRARGGRDGVMDGYYRNVLNFNSRARGGRDIIHDFVRHGLPISTHAPAGGATAFALHNTFPHPDFNSRARGGRDSYARTVRLSD